MLTNDLPLKFDSCRRVKQQLPANVQGLPKWGNRIPARITEVKFINKS